MKIVDAFLLVIACLFALASNGQGKVLIDIYASEKVLINDVLLGGKNEAANIKYKGTLESRALFKLTNTHIPFESGIILSTGDARTIPGENRKSGFSGLMNALGDDELQTLSKARTFDAATFEFDFVPTAEIIKFNYVFGSEEYPEYVGSGFNDVFGFFLVDLETEEVVNLAVIPNTKQPITINTINDRLNDSYYIDNRPYKHLEQPKNPLELDGFTTKLTAYSEVVPGRKYRIKIGIADAGDDNLDSAVFLEEGSFEYLPKETFYLTYKEYIDGFSKPELSTKIPTPQTNTTTVSTVLDTKQLAIDSLALLVAPQEEKSDTQETSATVKQQLIMSQPLTLFFQSDASTLEQAEQDKLHEWLSLIPVDAVAFELFGYTDSDGAAHYNKNLASERNKSVAQEIKLLRPAENIQKSISFGENNPVASNLSASGKAKNRRVVVKVVPQIK